MLTRFKRVLEWLRSDLGSIYVCNATAGALLGMGLALWTPTAFGLFLAAGACAAFGYMRMRFYAHDWRIVDERQWQREVERCVQRVVIEVKQRVEQMQGVEGVDILKEDDHTTRH
jgi:hypothetical protein